MRIINKRIFLAQKYERNNFVNGCIEIKSNGETGERIQFQFPLLLFCSLQSFKVCVSNTRGSNTEPIVFSHLESCE